MAGFENDPLYWRLKGEEALVIRDQMIDSTAKAFMQSVANSYFHIARLAEEKPLVRKDVKASDPTLS
jgi:hypothetical protein